MNCLAPGNVLFPGGSWERHLQKRREEVENYISAEVPQKRFGTPEEIADFAAYLVSPVSGFATGGCYIMDGGQTTKSLGLSRGTALHDLRKEPAAPKSFSICMTVVAIVTGGAGLLGYHHGAILADAGAHVVLLDLDVGGSRRPVQEQLTDEYGSESLGVVCDITCEASVEDARKILERFGRIDILINNAANNPKVEDGKARPGRGWRTFRLMFGMRTSVSA